MLSSILEALRWLLCGYIALQLYTISGWAAIAVVFLFLLQEWTFYVISKMLQTLELIKDIVLLKQVKDKVTVTQEDFGFSAEPLTSDEEVLVDKIRDGDGDASTQFLSGRCANKTFDFTLVPEVVRLILAQRLVNAINRNEAPTWSQLLTDKS